MNAVIVRAERQRRIVDNLVNHIRDLDGTEVIVIDAINETNEYPARNNYALWQAANIMEGSPFFWLEPDSIPLKSGWLHDIKKEYSVCCKEFMLSSDKNPPFDMIGGIGVYGSRTIQIIPKNINGSFKGHGWDTWMLYNASNMIHWSPLIQHSYGIYNHQGIADPHRFPRDNAMIRDNALVFHRDKFQELINK